MANWLSQTAGRAVGALGGLLEALPGQSGLATPLRDWGGQQAGGQRTYNLVPTARAYEAPGPQSSGGEQANPDFYGSQVQGASTGITGGNVTTNGPTGDDTRQNDINQQVDNLGQSIDNDYNTTMSGLASQESSLQGRAGIATKQIDADYAPAQTELQNTQTQGLASLTKDEQSATSTAETGMMQARDLFREQQQTNSATLSALGLSSSSVMEALSERLGIETSRRIASLSSNLSDVVNNIKGEATRVKEYFGSKMADLETQVGASKSAIQEQLLAGVREINQARNVAASAKANQRIQLMSQAQSALADLQAKAQDFQQELTMWNQKKSAALDDAAKFVVSPGDMSGLTAAAQGVGAISQTGLSGYKPSFSIDPKGYVSTKYEKEDVPPNPFAN